MVRHIAWIETDRSGVSEPVEREVPTCYRPRHALEQIMAYSPSLEQLVFYNDARKGFQRAKGAEMI